MGNPLTHRIMRCSGRLIFSPQDETNADGKWGGTVLGSTEAFSIQSLGEQYEIEGEGIGRPTDILEADRRYACGCALRSWDDDMVTQLMTDGDVTTGAVTGRKMWTGPGTSITPGESALGRAVVLLWAPDDYNHLPGVLVYNAIPQVSPGFEIQFGKAVETIIPFAARAFSSSSGQAVQIAMVRDMTFP